MDLILLFLLQKVSKKNSKFIRIFGAASVGAGIAVLVGIFLWIPIVLRFILMYIVSGVLMVVIAFGKMKLRELLKQVITLYFITYLVGGFMNSIYYYTNVKVHIIALGKGILYSNYSYGSILFYALLISLMLLISLWFFRWYRNNAPLTYDVELVLENRSIHTKGLLDTGNCLFDPLYHKPIMVVEHGLMNDLLSSEFQKELDAACVYISGNEDGVSWNMNSDHVLRLRFVPYQSIGKSGMMVGIVLDKVMIHTGKETICNDKVTAAICDIPLSQRKDYQVILHKELL